MVAGALGAALALIAVVGFETGKDVLLGMLGPLLVATVTWSLTERTYRRNPEHLTPLMFKAFAAKLVFFAGYVAAVIVVLRRPPVPFVMSFTGFFIGLHAMEAFGLKRLFGDGPSASR